MQILSESDSEKYCKVLFFNKNYYCIRRVEMDYSAFIGAFHMRHDAQYM